MPASSSPRSSRRCGRARAGGATSRSGIATGDAAAILQFGEQWSVRPSRELIERLGSLVGREGVELYYAPRDT